MEKIKNKSNQTEMLYKLFEDLLIENSNIIGINFFDYIINIDEIKTVIFINPARMNPLVIIAFLILIIY